MLKADEKREVINSLILNEKDKIKVNLYNSLKWKLVNYVMSEENETIEIIIPNILTGNTKFELINPFCVKYHSHINNFIGAVVVFIKRLQEKISVDDGKSLCTPYVIQNVRYEPYNSNYKAIFEVEGNKIVPKLREGTINCFNLTKFIRDISEVNIPTFIDKNGNKFNVIDTVIISYEICGELNGNNRKHNCFDLEFFVEPLEKDN